MPAYARNGKVVCFFQSAQKFKTRYVTLGFSDQANLDEGTMWPTTYALTELTAADEARIGALTKESGEMTPALLMSAPYSRPTPPVQKRGRPRGARPSTRLSRPIGSELSMRLRPGRCRFGEMS
jgi:hypothetical protein